MNLNKPKFWDFKKPNFLAYLLLPLTLFVKANIFFSTFYTKKKFKKIKSICVGNIYLGGTGKTPTTLKLYQLLKNLNYNVVNAKKHYFDQKDEYSLLNNKSKVISLKNRDEIIKHAIERNFDLIIFDDGLQEKKIDYDLKFVCFDSKNWIGNGLLIPSGPLRESLDVLKDVQVVIINGGKSKEFEDKMLQYNKNLNIFYSKYYPVNSNEFKKKKLLAVAGIANPKNFFDLLLKEGLDIEKKIIFPDHYQFKKSEIVNIVKYAEEKNLQIIMTEKDYFKIKKFNLNEIKYLKIILKIENCEKLIKLVSNIYD